MKNQLETNGFSPEERAEEYHPPVCTIEELSSPEAHEMRARRILALSDRILDKLSSAIDEVAMCVTKEKKKIKEVEYDEELKKPVSETYTETESSDITSALIDTSALKQLVSTLKDVKDIHLGFSKPDGSEGDECGVIVISDVEKEMETKQ